MHDNARTAIAVIATEMKMRDLFERLRDRRPLTGGQTATLVIGGIWLIGIGITLVNRYIT